MINLLYICAAFVVIYLIVLLIQIKNTGVVYDKAKRNIDVQHKGKYAVQFAGTDAMALIPYPIKDANPELKEHVTKYNNLTKRFWIICSFGIVLLVIILTS